MAHRVGLFIACLALAGCERPRTSPGGTAAAPATASVPAPPPAAPPPAEPAKAAADAAPEPPFVGTAGITEKKKPLGKSAVLVAVRAARHAGHDRVVFEHEGSLPGYRVEYVDGPIRRCGSGEPAQVAGNARLRVRLEPAAAHDDAGRATVSERDRQRKLSLAVLRELVLVCDFEGQVEWAVGLESPGSSSGREGLPRYRVLELDGPPRIVVDVRDR